MDVIVWTATYLAGAAIYVGVMFAMTKSRDDLSGLILGTAAIWPLMLIAAISMAITEKLERNL